MAIRYRLVEKLGERERDQDWCHWESVPIPSPKGVRIGMRQEVQPVEVAISCLERRGIWGTIGELLALSVTLL